MSEKQDFVYGMLFGGAIGIIFTAFGVLVGNVLS